MTVTGAKEEKVQKGASEDLENCFPVGHIHMDLD